MPSQTPRPRRILLIEDDAGLRNLFKNLLSRWGFRILEADSGPGGLKLAYESKPHLILSDWVLGQGPDGADVCAHLKKDVRTRSIPLILLTGARTGFNDELKALSSGADLYLTKSEVLGGRRERTRLLGYVRSLLSRPFHPSHLRRRPSLVAAPGLELDLNRHLVRVSGTEIADLSTKQFDLLYVLARKYPHSVSRSYLVRRVWKMRVRDREVDVVVSRLKGRIERGGGEIIESVFGKGYRLRPGVSWKAPAGMQ